MKISIAMATYNGAQYLREQLESFSAQTRLPDELVVCDDNSSDHTLEIVREFAQRAAFGVKIYCNETRLGFVQNFGRAIELCSGELIFLSDQDDVWCSNKIERVEQFFVDHPSTWLVVNDAEITDESLNPLGVTSAKRVEWSGLPEDALVNGCFMSFRAQLKTVILPIPTIAQAHDTWINTWGHMLSVRAFLPDVLQYYRRHTSNASQWLAARTRIATRWHLVQVKFSRKNRELDPLVASDRRLTQIHVLKERLIIHHLYLEMTLGLGSVVSDELRRLDVKLNANKTRKSIQSRQFWSRFIPAVNFYWSGGYRQFDGWKSLVKDLLR